MTFAKGYDLRKSTCDTGKGIIESLRKHFEFYADSSPFHYFQLLCLNLFIRFIFLVAVNSAARISFTYAW